MRYPIRVLAALSCVLLMSVGREGISPTAAADRHVRWWNGFSRQDQANGEKERELQIVQEVTGQILSSYVLPLDPVRLAVSTVEGMASSAGDATITVERKGDSVRLQAGDSWTMLPFGKDAKANHENLVASLRFIRKHAPGATTQDLASGAIDGMLTQLDAHSSFLPPEVYREVRIETQGNFGGIGIQVAVKDRHLTVVSPMAGTPADRAGLQPGDRIVTIDGAAVQDLTLSDAVNRLRGPVGTKVTLTILRLDSPGPFQVSLTREIIPLKPIKAVELEHGIGYVKITGFSEQSGRDVQQAVRAMNDKGVQGLILDLRGNHGGLFNESIRVAELFITAGQPIVSTTARLKNQSLEHKASNARPLLKVPMVLLVDGGSASASEIVAGALQDLKRALVIGAKTYGKGSVQTIIPLGDGSALRLTTAKYLTPLHRSIDGEGIHPDLVVRDQAEELSVPKAPRREPAHAGKRLRSRMDQEGQRKIGDEEGDPSVVIGRRETVDPSGDPVLGLAWRTLLMAQGADVDRLLHMARALLSPERGAALDPPAGFLTPR